MIKLLRVSKNIPEDYAVKERVGLWRARVRVCACAVGVARDMTSPPKPLSWARLSYEPERSARGKTSDGSISASSSVPDFCLQPQLLTGWAPTGSPPSYTLAGVEEPGDIVVFFPLQEEINSRRSPRTQRWQPSLFLLEITETRILLLLLRRIRSSRAFRRRIPWDTGWNRLSWHCCWEWWVALLCGWTWIWLGWILAGRKLGTNAHQQGLGISGRGGLVGP